MPLRVLKLVQQVCVPCGQGIVPRTTRELPLPPRRGLATHRYAHDRSGQRDWPIGRAREATGGAQRPTSNNAGTSSKGTRSTKSTKPLVNYAGGGL